MFVANIRIGNFRFSKFFMSRCSFSVLVWLMGFFASSVSAQNVSLEQSEILWRDGNEEEAIEATKLLLPDPHAHLLLARIYLTQESVDKAFKSASIAAENKLPGGLYLLGQLYQKGFGVEQDSNEALKLKRLAKRAGFDAYAEGYEVKNVQEPGAQALIEAQSARYRNKSIATIRQKYELAISQGSTRAKKELAEFNASESVVAEDQTQMVFDALNRKFVQRCNVASMLSRSKDGSQLSTSITQFRAEGNVCKMNALFNTTYVTIGSLDFSPCNFTQQQGSCKTTMAFNCNTEFQVGQSLDVICPLLRVPLPIKIDFVRRGGSLTITYLESSVN